MIDEGAIREAVAVFGAKAKKLVELTLADADQFMDGIHEAVEAADASECGRAGHALKSIMKQVGAKDVAALAEEMQHKGEEQDLAACIDLYNRMKPLYKETRNFMLTL